MRPDPRDIIKAASEIANTIKNNEKFALPLLAKRATKEAYNNPTDQTLRMMANVLNKKCEKGDIFISRTELNDIYSKFASSNSIANKVFAEELCIQKEAAQRELAGSRTIAPANIYDMADNKVANALSELWDDKGNPNKNGQYKYFDPSKAKQAEVITNFELIRLGCQPKNITTFCGSDNCIICDACYDTSKGESHLLIPVEISASGPMIPTIFVNKYGFANLNQASIKNHIKESAGKNFVVNGEQLIKTMEITKEASTLSDFELQTLAYQEKSVSNRITKEASPKQINILDSNSILMQEVNNDKPSYGAVELPKAKDTDTFASKLNTQKGTAEFLFGKQAVDCGRDIILNKLASYGYHAQASVSSCDDDSIMYGVKMDTRNGPIGFQAIAEVKDKKVSIPSVIAIKDKAYEFTKDGIETMIYSQASDVNMLGVVSPMYELNSNELLGTIKQAADDGNYKLAEDILSVLAAKNDKNIYNIAMTEYVRSLHNKDQLTKQAAPKQHGCTKIVYASNHSCPMCGHLNLPLDKVCQNEQGECIPLYRKNLPEKYDGAFFSTAKILG